MNQAEIYTSHQYACRKLSIVAALYALLALWNALIYSPTRFEVLGFSDDPIGWWVMFTFPLMIIFGILAIMIARQGWLYGARTQDQLKQLKKILLVLTILFAVPNVFIAFLHFNMGIPSGFSYWGEVRAAYEVPAFHLLPMLLLLYWWISSRKWR